MNTTNREQKNSQIEQSSQNVQPNKSGIKGKLLQFANPMRTYHAHDDKLPSGYTVVTLLPKVSGTNDTEQPVGSLNAMNTDQVTQTADQTPLHPNMGPGAQPPMAASFNPNMGPGAQPPMAAPFNPNMGPGAQPPMAASFNPNMGPGAQPPMAASFNPNMGPGAQPPMAAPFNPNMGPGAQPPMAAPFNPNMGPGAQSPQPPMAAPFNPNMGPEAQWQNQVRGGLVPTATNPHTNTTPTKMPTPMTTQEMKEGEVIDDPFTSPGNACLSLLSWPFRALGALFTSRRSIPALTQMAATECGAASLAMILSYYGHNISISEVSTQCGVGRDGLSASSIIKSARKYGLKARAISVQDTDRFEELDLPAIVHWQFNHFMVIERWTPKKVSVCDPAVGRKKFTRDEFDKGFTGIVILLEPSEQFTQQKGTSHNAMLGKYLQNAVRLAPGAVLQILLASLILLMFGLVMPATTAIVINSIVPLSLTDMLPTFALGMIMLVSTNIVLSYLRSAVLVKLESRVDAHLMISLFDHLLSLPLRYFQLRSSGDILSRMASNDVLRDTLNTQLISTVLDTAAIVVYLFILIKLAPMFALVALAFGLAQILLMICTNKHSLTLLRNGLEAGSKEQSYVTEALVEITTLKAAGAEKHVRFRWLRLFFAEMSASVKRSYFVSLIGALEGIIRSMAPLTLMLIGANQVIAGELQLGSMMALLSLATSFLGPLESLIGTGFQIQQAQAHLARIVDIMKSEPEQHGKSVMTPPQLKGHIQLVNVGFQYDHNAKHVLQNINVTIKPGQKVALVGRSGSGKSTLGKLLLGLYLPTQGEILYDGISLTSMKLPEVRAQFGVVMQDIGLFNGSVRENIAFNTPGISIDAVIWAAQNAAIHDDVIKMPMDYETIVSEGGSAISGGQRQRIALARALVRNPTILLLDEATSSLDVATERVVEQNLNRLSCTQIVIAHRLSTIRNADIILAVDQGTIIEHGTHEELVKHKGFYAHLIESQVASGDIEDNVSSQ